MPCGRKTWPEGSMTGVACCADDTVQHAASRILMHQEYQHGQSSVMLRNAGAWAAQMQLHGRIQDTTRSQYVRCLLCRWQRPRTSFRHRPQVSALPVLAQWRSSLGWRMRRRSGA